MRSLTRRKRRVSAEEQAAITAARHSKEAAAQVRAAAGEVAEASRQQYRRVRQLRVDNHLGWWLVEFARRGGST